VSAAMDDSPADVGVSLGRVGLADVDGACEVVGRTDDAEEGACEEEGGCDVVVAGVEDIGDAEAESTAELGTATDDDPPVPITLLPCRLCM
jgi:hypothetical protein